MLCILCGSSCAMCVQIRLLFLFFLFCTLFFICRNFINKYLFSGHNVKIEKQNKGIKINNVRVYVVCVCTWINKKLQCITLLLLEIYRIFCMRAYIYPRILFYSHWHKLNRNKTMFV